MTDPNPTPRSAAGNRSGSRVPHDIDLRVSIAGIEPAIWRLVRVPDAYTLHQLHRVFQLLFGWQDYHLYDFRIGERRFEAPDPEAEGEDSTRTRLRQLGLEAGSRFTYVYDYGDNWEHEIVVEAVHGVVLRPEEPRFPIVIDGARAGPHEDSGGRWGYAEMVKALRNKRNPQHRTYRDWAGPTYDPERFDPWLAGQNLVLAAAWGAI
jgi:hypothetical protein